MILICINVTVDGLELDDTDVEAAGIQRPFLGLITLWITLCVVLTVSIVTIIVM